MKGNLPKKQLPIVPLTIGGIVTLSGCLLVGGMLYMLLAPASSGQAQVSEVTPTRPTFVTATPILTMTPTPTDTVTPTSTATQTMTPSPTSTRPPSTRIPPTFTPSAIPPTKAPLGLDIGLNQLNLYIDTTTVSMGDHIDFTITIHNATGNQIPFGIWGATAHDLNGNPVALRMSYTNTYLDPNQYIKHHDFLKIYATGQFDMFEVICFSQNDMACVQPGADWHQLSKPIRITVN